MVVVIYMYKVQKEKIRIKKESIVKLAYHSVPRP